MQSWSITNKPKAGLHHNLHYCRVLREKRYGHLSVEVQMDALRLSLWYLEVILLKKFEYCGQYMNRLRFADGNPFENVPWANGNLEL